jgi:hypothetical protein
MNSMKKLLMLAAVPSALAFAAPATAQNYNALNYGQDAIGIINLEANVASFCRFGTVNSAASRNNTGSTAETTNTSEADGRFVLNIQNPANNTIKDADAEYFYKDFTCNSAFTVSAVSANGGLKSNNTTSDPAFTSLVRYNIDGGFDGIAAGARAIPAAGVPTTLVSSNEARAGDGSIFVGVIKENKQLLQGAYNDTLTITMAPKAGGGSSASS